MDDAYSLNDLVASEIRGWLGRRRMSGRQLAGKIGASQTWMSTRLRGNTEISLNDLGRIAGGLGVDVADLLPQPALRDERGNKSSPRFNQNYGGPSPSTPNRPPNGPRRINRPTSPERPGGVKSPPSHPAKPRPAWTRGGSGA